MFKFATRRGFSKFFGTRTPHDSTDSVAKVSGLPSPSCGGSQGILWCGMYSYLLLCPTSLTMVWPRNGAQGGPDALIGFGIFEEIQEKLNIDITFSERAH